MGRKGSLLIPFLIDGLSQNKFGSFLVYVDEVNCVFRLNLPRKAKNVHYMCIDILKAWDAVKGHVGKFNFTKAKQRLTSALRESDFLEKMPDTQYPLTYKILSSEEIKVKKQSKKIKSSPLKYSAPLSNESGYESHIGSPLSVNEFSEDESNEDSLLDQVLPPNWICSVITDNNVNNTCNILDAINHDHNFGYSLEETVKNDDLADEMNGRNSVNTDRGNEDNIPLLEESEISKISDEIFVDSPFSLQDLKTEVAAYLNNTKFYRIKFENVLKETILLTCELMDGISTNGFTYIADGIALHNDDIKRIYNHQITKMISEDKHLLLFLKPLESSFGKY